MGAAGPFWIGVGSAVVTADQIPNVFMLILIIPASIGIISDPTTKGLSDRAQALIYDKPRADGEEK